MCFTSMRHYALKNSQLDFYVIALDDNPFLEFYKKSGICVLSANLFYDTYLHNVDSHQWSKFVYVRFAIFKEPIFKEYDLTIYADVDTICKKPLDQDLRSLADILDSQEKIGMIPELHCQYVKSSKELVEVCNKINLNYTMGSCYCNAGMIYIPKKVLHDDAFIDIILQNLQYSSLFLANDQDMINCLIGNKIFYLDPIYNLHPGTFAYSQKDRMLNDVKIVHYAAITKYEKFRNMISHFDQISNQVLDKGI